MHQFYFLKFSCLSKLTQLAGSGTMRNQVCNSRDARLCLLLCDSINLCALCKSVKNFLSDASLCKHIAIFDGCHVVPRAICKQASGLCALSRDMPFVRQLVGYLRVIRMGGVRSGPSPQGRPMDRGARARASMICRGRMLGCFVASRCEVGDSGGVRTTKSRLTWVEVVQGQSWNPESLPNPCC